MRVTFVGSGDLNSGPRICVPSPIEHFPSPLPPSVSFSFLTLAFTVLPRLALKSQTQVAQPPD